MVKCPCLYSTAAPICRADMESMRIPPVVHLNRYCLTEHYRRCDLYRRFLETLAHEPGRWRVQGIRGGAARGDDAGLSDSTRARKS